MSVVVWIVLLWGLASAVLPPAHVGPAMVVVFLAFLVSQLTGKDR